LGAERMQRRGYRVGNHATDRNDATFACALRAERIVRRRLFLKCNRPDAWEIVSRREQIIGERSRQQLALLIIYEVLQERAAKPLDNRTHHLAVQGQGIDDAANVLDRDIIKHLDMARLYIDCDMGSMRAVAVGALVAGEACLGRKPSKACKW